MVKVVAVDSTETLTNFYHMAWRYTREKTRRYKYTFCAFLLMLRLLDFCRPYWLLITFNYMYKVET